MKTIELAKTGKQVSSLCFGAMRCGTLQNEKESFALLDQYFEAGGRFIDTANNYSYWYEGGEGGESEAVLGKWMKARNNRDQLFLATKVGFNTPKQGHGLSKKLILQEFEGSLERLQTDYIDLYYAHKDHREDPLSETLETFNQLSEEGKVYHIGCSNMRAWRIAEAKQISQQHSWAEYCGVQQRHSYLRPRPGAKFTPQLASNEDLLDYCQENPDVTLLAYSPLLGGAYTRDDRALPEQYKSADNNARINTLKDVAAQLNATANQVILAWMLQGSPTVLPVISASTSEQLTENLGTLSIMLSAEQLELLTTAGNPV